MERNRNPFRFGGEIGARDLVDRETETAQVENTIRNGEKLFLIGPRRFGKTSILRSVTDRLENEGAIVLRIDADPVSDLNVLVSEIVARSAARLKGKVEQVVDQVRKAFARVKPELRVDLNEHRWTAIIGIQPAANPGQSVAVLVDALNGLEELALNQPESTPVGLIIDEFQHVIELGGERTEAQIRSAIQKHARVGYVFAGSDTRMMTSMTANHDRPFYRLGSVRTVGPIPRKDFSAFIAKSFKKSGFAAPEPASIEAILDLAEDVPYNVQSLAHACWEELRSTGGAEGLTGEIVRKALERSVMELDPIYTDAWTRLTRVQQNTLRAFIREKGVGLSSAAVVRTIGASSSTVHRALEALENQRILRPDPAEGVVRIRFDDPFFAHWIRMRTMNQN